MLLQSVEMHIGWVSKMPTLDITKFNQSALINSKLCTAVSQTTPHTCWAGKSFFKSNFSEKGAIKRSKTQVYSEFTISVFEYVKGDIFQRRHTMMIT